LKKTGNVKLLYEKNREFISRQAKEPFSKSEILQNIRLLNSYQVYFSNTTRIIFAFIYLILFIGLALATSVIFIGIIYSIVDLIGGDGINTLDFLFIFVFPASSYYSFIFLKQTYGALFSKRIDHSFNKIYSQIIKYGVITTGKLEKREIWVRNGSILHYEYFYQKKKIQQRYYLISNRGFDIQVNTSIVVLAYKNMSFIL